MEQAKYRAFLSYSHRDARWANWLHRALETYRPPRQLVGTLTQHGEVPRRLAPVFRDRDELASATDLGSVITEALAQSACQIVICSPSAARSHWVNEEILAFKRLGREDRIFCLVIDGEPNASAQPGLEASECFPPALRFRLDPSGGLSQVPAEPVAADARPGKDGRFNAKLKLIAGVLGVPFDALKRREQQRRNRRLFAVACSALAGMVVTSGLAAYALFERAAAQRQTARAEAEAETARRTTEFLVNLFRISDPGEARGNQVTAREMLDRGAQRIDAELAGQPGVRATLMDTLGTVYMGLGLYDQARPLLDRALTTRQALAGSGTTVAASLTHRAELLTWQGDFGGAESAYREALQRLASGTDHDARATLAEASYGLGFVLGAQGRTGDARASLMQALSVQRALYGPESEPVARSLKQLANAASDAGDLGTALTLMRQAVAIQRALQGGAPHPALAEAINDLANLVHDEERYEEAQTLYEEALAMKRRLYGERHAEVAAGMIGLAGVLADKGDLAGAEALYREGLAMERATLGEGHSDVGATLNNLALVQYDRGEVREAMANLKAALRNYQAHFPGDHPMVARVMSNYGLWLTLAGNYTGAQSVLEAALAMRRRLGGERHPDTGASLMHLAILKVAQRDCATAEAAARDARRILGAALSATHWETAMAESAEGAALAGLGRTSEASALLREATRILEADAAVPPTYRRIARRYARLLGTHN